MAVSDGVQSMASVLTGVRPRLDFLDAALSLVRVVGVALVLLRVLGVAVSSSGFWGVALLFDNGLLLLLKDLLLLLNGLLFAHNSLRFFGNGLLSAALLLDPAGPSEASLNDTCSLVWFLNGVRPRLDFLDVTLSLLRVLGVALSSLSFVWLLTAAAAALVLLRFFTDPLSSLRFSSFLFLDEARCLVRLLDGVRLPALLFDLVLWSMSSRD